MCWLCRMMVLRFYRCCGANGDLKVSFDLGHASNILATDVRSCACVCEARRMNRNRTAAPSAMELYSQSPERIVQIKTQCLP